MESIIKNYEQFMSLSQLLPVILKNIAVTYLRGTKCSFIMTVLGNNIYNICVLFLRIINDN